MSEIVDGLVCGCEIIKIPIFKTSMHSIEYCPLHEAAPLLLEACKALLKADLYADGEGIVNFDYPNTSDGDEAKEQAIAAIAAATK